jgi:hypothetical protein
MSILKNINYIKKLSVIGCSAPDIFVAVETGFQAAAPALLSLFAVGCTDIVKMKLGKAPWHHKGIGGLLKGAAPPFSAGANKFLYKIGYFTAEKGLWWFMVADVAVEFEAQWNSLVFAAQQCPLPSAGTAYGYIAPFIYGPGQETTLAPVPVHNVPGMAVGLNNVAIFPGFLGTVNFSTEWDSWPVRGQGVSVSTWMEEIHHPEPISYYTTNNPPSQPHNETIGHTAFDTLSNLTRTDYIFHMANTGDTFAQVVNSTYSVSLSGHPTGVMPWGCHPKKTTLPFG